MVRVFLWVSAEVRLSVLQQSVRVFGEHLQASVPVQKEMLLPLFREVPLDVLLPYGVALRYSWDGETVSVKRGLVYLSDRSAVCLQDSVLREWFRRA